MFAKRGEVAIDGNEFVIISTNDIDVTNAPMTVYVNQSGNRVLGEYVYTISGYSTLLNSVDNTRSAHNTLAKLLSKKVERPVYLNVNGMFGESDVVPMFKAIMETVSEGEEI